MIELSKFMLYYTQVILLIFCIYLFNDKLEWILLISSFYMTILFTYGLTSELYKSDEIKFIKDSILNPIADAIVPSKFKKTDTTFYSKYLLLIPVILHLSSIKLITNNEGNKKIQKSKSKTKQLNYAKIFICLTTILFAITTILGFNPNIFGLNTIGIGIIPTISIPILFIVSIIEIILAVNIYKSY